MDYHKIRGEINDFVLNAPDKVNAEVAVFIAEMQARKKLMDCRQKTDNHRYRTNPDVMVSVKSVR